MEVRASIKIIDYRTNTLFNQSDESKRTVSRLCQTFLPLGVESPIPVDNHRSRPCKSTEFADAALITPRIRRNENKAALLNR